MKLTTVVSVCAAMLIAGHAWAQNELGPLYTIHHVSGITIDGDVSDWGNAEWVTYSESTVAETGGFWWEGDNNTITFTMAYTEDALYCAAQVEDDVISYNEDGFTAKEWWTRDGVQWFIDFTGNPEQDVILYPDAFDRFEGENEWLQGEMIAAFGATEDQSSEFAKRWMVGTRNGTRSDNVNEEAEFGAAWESVVVITDTGYIVEARIPWDSLETSAFVSDPEDTSGLTDQELDNMGWDLMRPEPLAGSTILFTHLCTDPDNAEGGFGGQVMWVGNGDTDLRWTEAVFAEATNVDSWMIHE